ncbi:MAG TPA: MlaD family protein, partial [Nocardioidaceae bacterium]|nr:MlaD family protein [Nocardioidaceae bacterium]
MIRRLSVAAVVTLLVLAGLTWLNSGSDSSHTLTATFSRTTSLYEGANVKVLGVKVGRVESITVKGTAVEVVMSYDKDVELPAGVHALIVPPSIVGDRFVQLAPVYTEGEILPDNAELGLDRTGVPLELDDTYRGLDKVAAALGPQGANENGALSRLIAATAASLDGNGALLNDTLREFA